MRIKLSMSGINEIGQRCGIFEFEENIKSKKKLPKIIEDAIFQYKSSNKNIVTLSFTVCEMVILEKNILNF